MERSKGFRCRGTFQLLGLSFPRNKIQMGFRISGIDQDHRGSSGGSFGSQSARYLRWRFKVAEWALRLSIFDAADGLEGFAGGPAHFGGHLEIFRRFRTWFPRGSRRQWRGIHCVPRDSQSVAELEQLELAGDGVPFLDGGGQEVSRVAVILDERVRGPAARRYAASEPITSASHGHHGGIEEGRFPLERQLVPRRLLFRRVSGVSAGLTEHRGKVQMIGRGIRVNPGGRLRISSRPHTPGGVGQVLERPGGRPSAGAAPRLFAGGARMGEPLRLPCRRWRFRVPGPIPRSQLVGAARVDQLRFVCLA